MRALGANLILVPFDVAWRALHEHRFEGVEGTLVHPFDDHDFIAGHATMGLEILEDAHWIRAAELVSSEAGGRTSQVWQIEIHDEQQRLICISRITMAVVAIAPHMRVP